MPAAAWFEYIGRILSVTGTQRSVGRVMLLLLSRWTDWLIRDQEALKERSSVIKARRLTRGSKE